MPLQICASPPGSPRTGTPGRRRLLLRRSNRGHCCCTIAVLIWISYALSRDLRTELQTQSTCCCVIFWCVGDTADGKRPLRVHWSHPLYVFHYMMCFPLSRAQTAQLQGEGPKSQSSCTLTWTCTLKVQTSQGPFLTYLFAGLKPSYSKVDHDEALTVRFWWGRCGYHCLQGCSVKSQSSQPEIRRQCNIGMNPLHNMELLNLDRMVARTAAMQFLLHWRTASCSCNVK